MKYFLGGFISMWMVLGVIQLLKPDNSKYTIYAADKVYHCNEFQVSGNTIYFKDIRKKNVCINGNYTLIYETEDKQ